MDLNTCGGTHIASTDQILSFFITASKKNELHFICGLKGLSFIAEHNQALLEVSQSINQPIDTSLSFLSSQFSSLSKQQLENSTRSIVLLRSLFELLHRTFLTNQLPDKSVFSTSSSFKDILSWNIWSQSDFSILVMDCPVDKKIVSEAIKIVSDFEQVFISMLLVANETLIISVNHPDRVNLNAKTISDKFKEKFSCKGGGNEFFSQLLLKGIDFATLYDFSKTIFPA